MGDSCEAVAFKLWDQQRRIDFVCDGPKGWVQTQHLLFQLANLFILFSFFTPHSLLGHMVHKLLISAGFFCLAVWVWVLKCSPDATVWNFFLGLQALISVHIDLWKLRVFYFGSEAEGVYQMVFRKCGATRYDFSRILSAAKWGNLSQGLIETRDKPSNRLRLVVTGRADVSRNQQLIYSVPAMEFIESLDVYEPTLDPITIVEETRVLIWKKNKLSELKDDSHLRSVLESVLGRDIGFKLSRLYEASSIS
jgi:hypothetical protein